MSPENPATQFGHMSLNDDTVDEISYNYPKAPDASQSARPNSIYSTIEMGMPDPSGMPSPPVTFRVEGLSFQYQFTEDDVRKVFSRYGEVVSVLVGADGASATITFTSFANGMAARSDLDGKQLAGINGAFLRVDCPALSQPHQVWATHIATE